MDNQTSQPSQIVEIDTDMDIPVCVSGFGGSMTCTGANCDFSDPKTSSTDSEARSASARRLLIAVVLCITFMTIEVIGGIKANSLAVLTDAAHLLSDLAAFAISLFSLWASSWQANPRQSYGFFRVEILGTLVSIQLVWLLAGILVYEAIARIVYATGEVDGRLMFAVSAFGLVVNVAMAALLGHDHGHDHSHSHCRDEAHRPLLKKNRNINVHSAYLHALSDSIQSAGVMIGGAIIWYKPEWKIVDLVCTLVFSVIVLLTTVRMVRSVLEVLMESTPREIDAARLERGLCEVDGVVAVHELHVWAITVGKVLLACHVTVAADADSDSVLERVIEYIRREYSISHVTIQVERV